jgi:hypothetical protein
MAVATNAGGTELTRHTRNCLTIFAESPDFPFKYAGALLVALCRVDPDGLPIHLALMRRWLDPQMCTVEGDTEADREEDCRRRERRETLINNLKQCVGKNALLATLSEASTHRDKVGLDWWYETVKLLVSSEDMECSRSASASPLPLMVPMSRLRNKPLNQRECDIEIDKLMHRTFPQVQYPVGNGNESPFLFG